MLNQVKHQLYFKDCIEGVKNLPDSSLNLILSGPPYYNHSKHPDEGELKKEHYQDFINEISPVWKNLVPKLKDGGIVALWRHDVYFKEAGVLNLFPYHSKVIESFPPELNLRQIIIWDRYLKKVYGHLPDQNQFGNRFQYIMIFSKGKTGYEKELENIFWSPFWYFKTTPKVLGSRAIYRAIFVIGKIPLVYSLSNKLFGWIRRGITKDDYKYKGFNATCPSESAHLLMKMFSRKGDTVCDPFLGSGTTIIEADKLRRNSVCFEINKDARGAIEKKVGGGKIDFIE